MSSERDERHGGRSAVLAALAANVAIALAKVIGFLLTGSSSMASEAVHSFADCGNEVLLLFGARQAAKAPDEAHPFGYGAEHFFWAFLVSVVLFSVGALFSLREGVDKLDRPHHLDSPAVALIILVASIILEALSFRKGTHEANKVRGDRSWRTFIRRSKNPDLTVVLLEDTAALIGLSAALAGVILSVITGNAQFDGIGSLVIAAVLALVAMVMGVEMKSLLVGESASSEDRAAIATAIASVPAVQRIIHMRTQQLGPDEVLVAVKVAVEGSDTAAATAGAVDEAERRIRMVVPAARYIFVETDVDRGPTPPA